MCKFADESSVAIGISNNDEAGYRKKIQGSESWSQDNNLSLTGSKMKEPVIGLREGRGVHMPVSFNGAKVEAVESFKFHGINISNNLSCTNHNEATPKTAHKHVYLYDVWDISNKTSASVR